MHATIGFRSLLRPATTAPFDSGSSALAGRMGSPAGTAAESCTFHPADMFLRAECVTSSPTKAGKSPAVFQSFAGYQGATGTEIVSTTTAPSTT
jgi:hypothetical protein